MSMSVPYTVVDTNRTQTKDVYLNRRPIFDSLFQVLMVMMDWCDRNFVYRSLKKSGAFGCSEICFQPSLYSYGWSLLAKYIFFQSCWRNFSRQPEEKYWGEDICTCLFICQKVHFPIFFRSNITTQACSWRIIFLLQIFLSLILWQTSQQYFVICNSLLTNKVYSFVPRTSKNL